MISSNSDRRKMPPSFGNSSTLTKDVESDLWQAIFVKDPCI